MKKVRPHSSNHSLQFCKLKFNYLPYVRACLIGLIIFCGMLVTPRPQAQSKCDPALAEGCNFNQPTNLVFLLDRSGRIASRGQTYDAQKGAIRALKELTIAATNLPVYQNSLTISLTGKVSTNLRLINPTNPGAPPVVDFTRTGDEFSVSFSVFDSNLNANRASYEFLDRNGRTVGQVIEVDMMQEIQARGLVKGQSFTITQKFSGAKDNKNITQVRVTVSDNESSVTATAGLNVISPVKSQSLRHSSKASTTSGASIVMPKRSLAEPAQHDFKTLEPRKKWSDLLRYPLYMKRKNAGKIYYFIRFMDASVLLPPASSTVLAKGAEA